MSPKSGDWVQIAWPTLLSCLNGHSLMACQFQHEDSRKFLITLLLVGGLMTTKFWSKFIRAVSIANRNIIIIIIMSCRQHGIPWPSLATSPYYSSPLVGLQGYILCPHIAAVCMFELVVLLLLGHMRESIGVYHNRNIEEHYTALEQAFQKLRFLIPEIWQIYLEK